MKIIHQITRNRYTPVFLICIYALLLSGIVAAKISQGYSEAPPREECIQSVTK